VCGLSAHQVPRTWLRSRKSGIDRARTEAIHGRGARNRREDLCLCELRSLVGDLNNRVCHNRDRRRRLKIQCRPRDNRRRSFLPGPLRIRAPSGVVCCPGSRRLRSPGACGKSRGLTRRDFALRRYPCSLSRSRGPENGGTVCWSRLLHTLLCLSCSQRKSQTTLEGPRSRGRVRLRLVLSAFSCLRRFPRARRFRSKAFHYTGQGSHLSLQAGTKASRGRPESGERAQSARSGRSCPRSLALRLCQDQIRAWPCTPSRSHLDSRGNRHALDSCRCRAKVAEDGLKHCQEWNHAFQIRTGNALSRGFSLKFPLLRPGFPQGPILSPRICRSFRSSGAEWVLRG